MRAEIFESCGVSATFAMSRKKIAGEGSIYLPFRGPDDPTESGPSPLSTFSSPFIISPRNELRLLNRAIFIPRHRYDPRAGRQGRYNLTRAHAGSPFSLKEILPEQNKTQTRDELGSLADRDTAPAFYVSMQDADRYALLLGPFADEHVCRQYAYSEPEDGGNPALSRAVRQLAYEIDPKSHFYGFGMARTETARRAGILHGMFGHGELETKLQNRGGTIPRHHPHTRGILTHVTLARTMTALIRSTGIVLLISSPEETGWGRRFKPTRAIRSK